MYQAREGYPSPREQGASIGTLHNFPDELPAIEGSVMRFRAGVCGLKGPAFLGIKNGYVGVAAACERATAPEVDHAGGTCGTEFDDSHQRNFVLTMQTRDG